MYCNTLTCIAERAETVSQYSLVYCDLRAAGALALYCNTMYSRVVTQQAGCWCAQAWALGRARRKARGRGRGRKCKRACTRGSWAQAGGSVTHGARGARGRGAAARGRGAAARGRGAAGARQRAAGARQRAAGARQREAWALGTRPGRVSWSGLCTQCTPLGFQPGFSTRYFS